MKKVCLKETQKFLFVNKTIQVALSIYFAQMGNPISVRIEYGVQRIIFWRANVVDESSRVFQFVHILSQYL